MTTKKLSDEALLGELNKRIAYAKSHSQISVSWLVAQLNPLVKDFKGLVYSVLYNGIKSYRNAGQTAIKKNRENSFDNQTGMLRRLNKIKAEYLESLVEPYSLLYN